MINETYLRETLGFWKITKRLLTSLSLDMVKYSDEFTYKYIKQINKDILITAHLDEELGTFEMIIEEIDQDDKIFTFSYLPREEEVGDIITTFEAGL